MLDPFEAQRVSLPSGALTLSQSRGYDGDGLNERTLRQSLYFEMSFDKELSLQDAVDVVQRLAGPGNYRHASGARVDYLHLCRAEIFTEGPNGSGSFSSARWSREPPRSSVGTPSVG